MQKRSQTWEYLQVFTPAIVRILGRTGSGRGARALSDEEVAVGSGLTLERVRRLQLQNDWKGVDIPTAEAFCRGCGFDPTLSRDRQHKCFMYFQLCEKRKTEPFGYLKNSPNWPKYQKLLNRIRPQPKASAA